MQKVINFLRGSVRLEAEGAFPERFLNLCAQNGVAFWAVEWLETGRVAITVPGVTPSGPRPWESGPPVRFSGRGPAASPFSWPGSAGGTPC